MKEISWRTICAGLAVAGALALVPEIGSAQTGKISGIATDASTGQPVEGVQISLRGTGYGAITQANGRYFIISVPPGTYSVLARRIGYQSTEVTGVQVRIDVTREINLRLNTAATTLATQVIVAESAPLVEQGITGSSTTITADVIQSLPVTSIAGVLSLQQGFLDVPQNTNLQSLAEEQRSTVAPIRVRGGRGGSTITLIDGIPINNPIFGTEAIRLNALAVSGIEFVRGYMEPQYGNGLSGVINQATREGGTNVAGSIDYQTSTLAGALGSDADKVAGFHLLRGYLSGPIPGTADKVRYAVSGQVEYGASRVLEFDQDVFSFNRQQNFEGLAPKTLDILPGFRAFGGRENQQIVGKVTFVPSARSGTKLNLNAIIQERANQGYDRRFLLAAAGDPLALAPTILDSLGLFGSRGFRDLVQGSVRDETRLYGATLEQRFGRTTVQLRGARTEFERNTCNVFLGVCIPNVFINGNFDEQFIAPFGVVGLPLTGGDAVSGGEKYDTYTVRADLQSQVTDHHNLQAGGSFVRHDVVYGEIRGIGGNSGIAATVNQLYRAKPIEAGVYLQDRIEFDFLTVKLGARYDYGRAQGRGFSDPLNPTNGTTALEVCEGNAPGINSNPFTFTNDSGTTFTGRNACSAAPGLTPGARSFLIDSAAKLAQQDDFREAKARTAFSPRIGVSFPLTERSTVFFNAGRYTMNPLYHNLYRNSGIGVRAGPEDGFCDEDEVKPGTNECTPPLTTGNPDFVGNPNLLLEQATQYEVGYGAEIGRAFAINIAVYNRDETGLSGLERSRAQLDIGTTYEGSLPAYVTITNRDFLTSRGVEVQFRRRLINYWQFDINYGTSRTTTNSPPPDRSFETLTSGEINRSALREIISDIDQTHRLNATVGLAVRDDAPDFRFGSLLKNTSATVTYRFSSGFPYTPFRAFNFNGVTNNVNAADINAGRAPSTQQVDLILQKGFQLRNVRYGAFVRVDNAFDRKNCVQVFVNTGTCDSGLRDPLNRRVGNFDEVSSTNFDQPEFVGARRSIFTGLSINF